MNNKLMIFHLIPDNPIDLKVPILISLILVLLTHIIPLSELQAQEHDLRFKHFTSEEGLSHDIVNCIYQDSRGFMWFGTNEGLDKYDGYEFTLYERGSNKTEKMSNDYIICITEDSNGNLWIGTANGLNLYDKASNNFTHFTKDSSSEIKLRNSYIQAIFKDSQENLWLGTEKGIDLINLENKQIVSYIPDHFIDINSNNSRINVLFEDSQHILWFGTREDGLGMYDYEKRTCEYFRYNFNDKTSISDNDIRSIYKDNCGNLWVGTYNGGFNLFNRERKEFYRFFPDPKIRESLTVKAILDYDNDKLWIGTRNGVYLFNKKTHQFSHYHHDPRNPNSLSNNNVQAIYKDSNGDFWFGTKGGINFLGTRNIPFVHYRTDIYNNRCLNNGLVSAICEDSRGDLWFGTSERGLNRLNRETGIFTYYTHDPDDPNSIGSNNVNTIVEDKGSNLWIGTSQGGLNLFDRKGNRFIHYKLNPNVSLIYQDAVRSILLDRNNEIWIGSARGIYQLNKKEKSFIQFPLNKTGSEPSINCIIQTREGKIWAGCNNGKMYCIDKTASKHECYKLPGATDYTRINDIIEDRDGNFWLTTLGFGLYFFNKKQKAFQVYTKQDGLPNNILQSILEDERGILWISTDNGLSKFNPKTNEFKNYFKENGLQSNQFVSACLKTRSGEMFFGGINGATAFYPAEILKNTYVPYVVITDFKIFNKSVKIGGEDPILSKHINEADNIRLLYEHSVFSFNYAALDFGISKQIQYAYMMEGFEKDWNYVGTKRFATYTNLNPGNYVFKVKAANNDGMWSEEGASIKVIITPPFWMTWWFKIFSGLLIISVALSAYRIKVRSIKTRSEKLEMQVAERTSELQQKKEQVEESYQKLEKTYAMLEEEVTERKKAEEQIKESLEEKNVLLKEIHHRVKNNLQIIYSLLNLQAKYIENEQIRDMFKESQGRIRSMALIHEKLYQSQDLAKIDFTEYIKSLTKHLFNTYEMNNDIVKLKINVNNISLDVNTAIPCSLIINELVSNSLKHAFPDGMAGEICIDICSVKSSISDAIDGNDFFTLIISDNGIGLPEGLNYRTTHSLGLRLVTILVEDQLKGKIKLDRKNGTKFKINFKGVS